MLSRMEAEDKLKTTKDISEYIFDSEIDKLGGDENILRPSTYSTIECWWSVCQSPPSMLRPLCEFTWRTSPATLGEKRLERSSRESSSNSPERCGPKVSLGDRKKAQCSWPLSPSWCKTCRAATPKVNPGGAGSWPCLKTCLEASHGGQEIYGEEEWEEGFARPHCEEVRRWIQLRAKKFEALEREAPRE